MYLFIIGNILRHFYEIHSLRKLISMHPLQVNLIIMIIQMFKFKMSLMVCSFLLIISCYCYEFVVRFMERVCSIPFLLLHSTSFLFFFLMYSGKIYISCLDLKESNVSLKLTIVETIGFGDQINKEDRSVF